jgi:hypothetical protein
MKSASEFADVSWDKLEHAFGSASDLPVLLAAVSKARGARLEKRMGELCERVLHQGTIYNASPAVVHALIGMAGGAGPREKAIFYDVLAEFASSARQAIRDGRAIPCSSGGDPVDGAAILGEILQAHDGFAPDLQHSDPSLRGLAGTLLTASAEAGPVVSKLVRDRYRAENNPDVRLRLVNGLVRVCGAFPDWREFLDAAVERESDPACRFVLRRAQLCDAKADASAAMVDDLVATFMQANASEFSSGEESFFSALHLLGSQRELAVLLHTLELAAETGLTRAVAERLLRLVFDDRRTGWGQTSYSFGAQAGGAKAARPLDRSLFSVLLQAVGMVILWKLLPWLMRRKLRENAAKRRGTEKIDYWGLEGAAPILPAKLTGEQQAVLNSLAEKPIVWQFRTNLWELFGLPDNAEGLRQFVASRA